MKIFELNEDLINKNLINVSNKKMMSNFILYKGYITIIRDLHEAHNAMNYVINLQNKVCNEENGLQKYEKDIILARLIFHQAIIIYARWFCDTKNGKPKLHKNNYFKDKNKYLEDTHEYIMRLRNKYIAHNEEDILSSDSIFIKIDDNKNISAESQFCITYFEGSEKFQDIKKCIEVVNDDIFNGKLKYHRECILKQIRDEDLFMQ